MASCYAMLLPIFSLSLILHYCRRFIAVAAPAMMMMRRCYVIFRAAFDFATRPAFRLFTPAAAIFRRFTILRFSITPAIFDADILLIRYVFISLPLFYAILPTPCCRDYAITMPPPMLDLMPPAALFYARYFATALCCAMLLICPLRLCFAVAAPLLIFRYAAVYYAMPLY